MLLAVGIVFGGTELPSPDVTARPIDHPGFFVTNDTDHPVPVREQGTGDVYATTRSITGYAGGDQGVIISVERNSATGSGGRVEFSLSGYLIDMPTSLATVAK